MEKGNKCMLILIEEVSWWCLGTGDLRDVLKGEREMGNSVSRDMKGVGLDRTRATIEMN